MKFGFLMKKWSESDRQKSPTAAGRGAIICKNTRKKRARNEEKVSSKFDVEMIARSSGFIGPVQSNACLRTSKRSESHSKSKPKVAHLEPKWRPKVARKLWFFEADLETLVFALCAVNCSSGISGPWIQSPRNAINSI